MTKVVAIRPEPGLAGTLETGRAMGLDMAGWPLFQVRPLAWEAPDPQAIDGLLIGSGNAIRMGGPAIEAFRGKPVFAVGDATAQIAREAGFPIAATGNAGLQELIDGEAGHPLTLLRLAGVQHVPLRPPLGIVLVTRLVYETAALPVPPEMAQVLAGGALVLLYSGEAAKHLAAECARVGLPRERIALATLGPRVAEAAGGGWREVRSAESPDEAALLALARDMCH